MNLFRCPKCARELVRDGGSLSCSEGHVYDISRSGYVNLLGGSSSSHGDDRQMLSDRRQFLETGAYDPLLELLRDTASAYGLSGKRFLDAGCGEGWYSKKLFDALSPEYLAAVDVSKAAAAMTSKRFEPSLRFDRVFTAAASVNSLPFQDMAFDCVLSVFSPLAPAEFHRVLTGEGLLLHVIPLENHLMSLKAAVYDEPYPNPSGDRDIPGFEQLDRRETRAALTLDQPSLRALFSMTPYSHKTSPSDLARLNALSKLTVEAEFAVIVYKKLT